MKEPKFKINDAVKILFNGKQYTGKVFIVDKFGTFEQHNEPSYDVMVENMEFSDGTLGECLVKHVIESNVSSLQ